MAMSQFIQRNYISTAIPAPLRRLVRWHFPLVVIAFVLLAQGEISAEDASPESVKLEYFEKQVRPLLVEHCYSCHSAEATKVQAGLLVDSRSALLGGGESGAAIVPGNASESLLMEAIHYESYEMPPKGKMSDAEIEVFERWINDGAVWPDDGSAVSTPLKDDFDLQDRKQGHWMWRPIRSPTVPDVANVDWPRQELDQFILARLEAEGFHPAEDLDRAGLLRRLYFDLIGLPPTVEQLNAFLSDTRPDATERQVDQLLESAHFGERWGRHWLDLMRYAESRGHEFDNDAPNAFQYRDYVIRALNADVPYDQFVREHLAGDLLTSPRLHPEKGFNESILGTGFWFLGEWVHSPVDIRKDEADRFDNMIDVMSKSFLGVTVSCARCHDHKFDAISSKDYYALSGFLQSCDYRQVRFESLEHNRGIAKQLAKLERECRQRIEQQLEACGVVVPSAAELDPDVAPYVVLDYGAVDPADFLQDGFSFGAGPRRLAEPFVEVEGDAAVIRFEPTGAAVSDLFWSGMESISEKGVQNRSGLAKLPRSGRTLRTPTFELTSGDVACRVKGTGHVVACVDSHRLIAGPLHGETIHEIKSGEHWAKLNLSRYLGHRIHLEFSPAADSQLSVSIITMGASDEVLQRLEARETDAGESVKAFAEQANHCFEPGMAEQWLKRRGELQSRVQRRSALAMAMWDGTGEDDHVLIRGNASKPGEVAKRRFLSAVCGEDPMELPAGSGRLQLAEAINSTDNPLTHRVIVNRVWHHLMGRGIVPTTDDFGVLGQRPTHPELLDHLAMRFLQEGRSLKRIIRTIVLSRTYQMSSRFDPNAAKADPSNLLWHHRPPKRLEGEVIRDALLMVSGQLDETQFGEPIPIHLTAFMDGRGKPGKSGPMDGANRRSIYTAVRRNFISPFMLAFDTPVPFSTMGRRNASNVPAQALILLNDPFVIAQAELWAKRTEQSPGTIEHRIENMYRAAFAREPSEVELETARQFVGQAPESLDRWRDLAHALINMKEFIFLR